VTPPNRRTISIAVLAALVLAAVLLVVVAEGEIAAADAEIAAKQEMLAELRARALPAPSKPHEGPPPEAFLAGETEAIAANRLQEQVTRAVEGAGGAPESVAVARIEDGVGGSRRIDVEIGFEGTIATLQQAAFTLESGLPYVFVAALQVQTVERSGGDDPRLRVRMTCSGYWRAPPAEPAAPAGSGT
jgi:general secretion pathway protein M